MSHSTSVLSKTLQSITILQDANRNLSQGERIDCLLRGVEELYRNGYDGNSGVDNTKSLLSQSKYDASVPAHMLQSSEDLLSSKLDVQSHKLSMAHLYSSLVTEWMNSGEPMEGTAGAALAEEESSFEIVGRQKERLQNLCDQFVNIVFTPLETDEAEIDEYLYSFFDTDDNKKLLEAVRCRTQTASEALLQTDRPCNEKTIKECIKGLFEEDLLSDEKQAILRDWDAGDQGVPVLPRQQLNGKYRIWVDEDVLQAIFIHYIGISSCVSLKPILRDTVSDESNEFWRWHAGPAMTEREARRRIYYLDEWLVDVLLRRHFVPRRKNGKPRARGVSLEAAVKINGLGSIAKRRREDYVDNFCVAALPGRVNRFNNGLYANEGEQSEVADDVCEEAWRPEEPKAPTPKLNIKQFLLRTLVTETMIQQALHGQAAVVLKAPLNLRPSSNSLSANRPRTRRRGMPMARAPEKLIGELMLFVMDLAETGLQLYRLHDDLWVAGAPADTAKA
ncbi:LOW QUALITY PROTEIN: hypothetical protein LZ30DRAFT_749205 [Colletotrichum cereale]|nr:LOW QUALITY PROTEIN: hypothetical protein LZ30DRAFT_749205 [Colletotrichum cereale]